MNQFQIISLIILSIFYAAYFIKLLSQRKRGIQTNQMGKGNKKAKVLFIEKCLSVVTILIVPVEIGSIIINSNGLHYEAVRYFGLLLAGIGVVIFICAIITMRDSWRAGIPEEGQTQIVTNGIFKFSRNPAFLGFDILYIGILLAFMNALCLVVTLLVMLALHIQILQEETFLTKAFGQEYIEYKAKVGRYVPRIFNYFFLTLFIVAMGIAIGYHQITPTTVPSDYKEETITLEDVKGKPADFSMTMNHVKEMAKEPHASGSEEIEDVRSYLIQQFNEIGCDYQMHEFTADMKPIIDEEVAFFDSYIEQNPDKKAHYADEFASLGFASYEEKYRADVYCSDTDYINGVNYFVKIDAPNTEKGVMFVSHYDSTYRGPGAADDLISVACMLEALRDAKLKNKLTNDLYFLFTDAEELDLFGAKAFVRDFPEMKEKIDLVINLEARGNKGTLLMFETSDHNKGIVKALNKAVSHNSMFSFLSAMYKIMPNSTDLTEFLDAGYTGMNFAVVGGSEHYHQDTDNYENLDRDSAYMYFRTTLDLTDYLSSADLAELRSEEDSVYFPFIKGNTIILSNTFMFIFSCFLGLLTLIWILVLFLQKKANIKDCLITLALLLVFIIVVALLGLIGTYICTNASNSLGFIGSLGIMNGIFYGLSFITIVGVLLFVYIATKRAKNSLTLSISGMLLINIFNWMCVGLLNGLAYIFTIPLCILFLYSIIQTVIKNHSKGEQYFSFGYSVIISLLVLILYTPLIHLLYTALFYSLFFAYMILLSLAILPIAITFSACIIRKNNIVNHK